jgi:hypothetical protein
MKISNDSANNMTKNVTIDTMLSKNISIHPDTDKGILVAYYKTCKDIIEAKLPRKDCLYFIQKFGYAFGEFHMVEAKGDLIDAGLL